MLSFQFDWEGYIKPIGAHRDHTHTHPPRRATAAAWGRGGGADAGGAQGRPSSGCRPSSRSRSTPSASSAAASRTTTASQAAPRPSSAPTASTSSATSSSRPARLPHAPSRSVEAQSCRQSPPFPRRRLTAPPPPPSRAVYGGGVRGGELADAGPGGHQDPGRPPLPRRVPPRPLTRHAGPRPRPKAGAGGRWAAEPETGRPARACAGPEAVPDPAKRAGPGQEPDGLPREAGTGKAGTRGAGPAGRGSGPVHLGPSGGAKSIGARIDCARDVGGLSWLQAGRPANRRRLAASPQAGPTRLPDISPSRPVRAGSAAVAWLMRRAEAAAARDTVSARCRQDLGRPTTTISRRRRPDPSTSSRPPCVPGSPCPMAAGCIRASGAPRGCGRSRQCERPQHTRSFIAPHSGCSGYVWGELLAAREERRRRRRWGEGAPPTKKNSGRRRCVTAPLCRCTEGFGGVCTMHLCGPSISMNTGGEWTIDCRWILPAWKIDSCSLEALLLRWAGHGMAGSFTLQTCVRQSLQTGRRALQHHCLTGRKLRRDLHRQ